MSILIATFATWLPHQASNAADDLVQLAIDRGDIPDRVMLLRHLPVENEAASGAVRDYVERCDPDILLCCGMAESRSRLNLERQAHLNGSTRHTSFDLNAWCDRLDATDISNDAGQFVCNYLYYQMLDPERAARAIFLHVPFLTDDRREACVRDFAEIVRLCAIAADYNAIA